MCFRIIILFLLSPTINRRYLHFMEISCLLRWFLKLFNICFICFFITRTSFKFFRIFNDCISPSILSMNRKVAGQILAEFKKISFFIWRVFFSDHMKIQLERNFHMKFVQKNFYNGKVDIFYSYYNIVAYALALSYFTRYPLLLGFCCAL